MLIYPCPCSPAGDHDSIKAVLLGKVVLCQCQTPPCKGSGARDLQLGHVGTFPRLCALAGGTRPGGRHQETLPERQQKLPLQMAALQIPQATSTEAPPSNILKVLLQPLSPGCIPCRLCACQPLKAQQTCGFFMLCV